jgi:hypothetical protein
VLLDLHTACVSVGVASGGRVEAELEDSSGW